MNFNFLKDAVCIVPAKKCSKRVPNKNYRPFDGSGSLVDITLFNLLDAGVPVRQVYVSCEDESMRDVVEQSGVNFLLREPRLADNDTPLTDWIRETAAQVPGDGDVIWAQVCNPFFNEYKSAFEKWDRWRNAGFDSLAVVHPFKDYLLDKDKLPIGWGFGPWHRKSQLLPTFYRFTWCLSILSRRSIDRVGYHIGEQPLWYEATGPVADIDTPEDFELARQLYAQRHAA